MKHRDRWRPPGLSRELPARAARKLRGWLNEQWLRNPAGQPATAKSLYLALAEAELSAFLSERHRLVVPSHEEPQVSIIVVLHNRAPLTYGCLQSIRHNVDVPAEILVVDNASTDDTSRLLSRVEGARVLKNPENLHFLRACNQAASAARGQFLLLLNNDAQLQPGALEAALGAMTHIPRAGVIGAKIVLLDGSLQEAGSIIWQDGFCAGYGRGDRPDAPMYMFRRDVDFVSAAFFLVRRDLFAQLGGFDEAFSPAYYEEVDFCLRARGLGYRIVFEPAATILHYEFGSSRNAEEAVQLQLRNRDVFVRRHSDIGHTREPRRPDRLLFARDRARPLSRILVVEDRVPHPGLGRGYPRSHRLLLDLVDRGHFVTLYPLIFPAEPWSEVYADIPREVEVMLSYGPHRLREFLQSRRAYYDTMLVCRPHNMELLLASVTAEDLRNLRLVYDAEAVFAMREVTRLRLEGAEVDPAQIRRMSEDEMELARRADTVLTVCERERSVFAEHGVTHAQVLGHSLAIRPAATSFAERQHILFTGAIPDESCPNADSILWFAENVFARIRERLAGVRLLVAGVNEAPRVRALASDSIRILGFVEDLEPLYATSRVFVAPTRFGAGIPLKVYEAAARGLPVVATEFVADELSWERGVDLLAAGGDPEDFAEALVRLYTDEMLWSSVRENALARCRNECSPRMFRDTLERVFG